MYSKTTYNPFALENMFDHAPLLDDEFDHIHESGLSLNRSHSIIID